jgi:hypothetical protein
MAARNDRWHFRYSQGVIMSTTREPASGQAPTGAPTIATVTPNTGKSSGGYPVTISGAELGNIATVIFGTNLATNVSSTDSSVNCTAPAGPLGTVQLYVADKYGNKSNELPFIYTAG